MFTAWIRFSKSENNAAKPRAKRPKSTVAIWVERTAPSSLTEERNTSTVPVVAKAESSALVLLMPAQKIIAKSKPMMPTGK